MPWPLFDFAFVSDIDSRLDSLANMAEQDENWGQTDSEGRVHPVLHSYLQFTFIRLQDENKIAFTAAKDKACFNTGLVTPNQEPIYAFFVPHSNPQPGGPSWYLKAFCRESDLSLTEFDELPDLANYFEDPKELTAE